MNEQSYSDVPIRIKVRFTADNVKYQDSDTESGYRFFDKQKKILEIRIPNLGDPSMEILVLIHELIEIILLLNKDKSNDINLQNIDQTECHESCNVASRVERELCTLFGIDWGEYNECVQDPARFSTERDSESNIDMRLTENPNTFFDEAVFLIEKLMLAALADQQRVSGLHGFVSMNYHAKVTEMMDGLRDELGINVERDGLDFGNRMLIHSIVNLRSLIHK